MKTITEITRDANALIALILTTATLLMVTMNTIGTQHLVATLFLISASVLYMEKSMRKTAIVAIMRRAYYCQALLGYITIALSFIKFLG